MEAIFFKRAKMTISYSPGEYTGKIPCSWISTMFFITNMNSIERLEKISKPKKTFNQFLEVSVMGPKEHFETLPKICLTWSWTTEQVINDFEVDVGNWIKAVVVREGLFRTFGVMISETAWCCVCVNFSGILAGIWHCACASIVETRYTIPSRGIYGMV